VDRRHNEKRCILAAERIHIEDAGIVIVGFLFKTLERGISQPRWPRALGPGPWRTEPEYQRAFSHLHRVSLCLTHNEPYVARSLVRSRTITWGPKGPAFVRYDAARHDATRRDAMRFGSPRCAGVSRYWDFVSVKCVRHAFCMLSGDLPKRDNDVRCRGKLCKIEIFGTITRTDKTISFYNYFKRTLILWSLSC